MWFEESCFYQIYTLGFCGAPEHNDGKCVNRIKKIVEWIPHFKKLGIDALYLCPVFESDSHGYDTKDYRRIDCRLGSDKDFKEVCTKLHQEGIKIVLDGVFNHVGRGFWAFQDVLKNKQRSAYKDWFFIDFGKNNVYDDGLFYEGWEGHFELVKLNLKNSEVVDHLSKSVKGWISDFDIDGMRLDVAYMLDTDFMAHLRWITKELKNDFFIAGEAIHGDYNALVNERIADSCTNYECYKSLYSSFNDGNLFEIAYSLNRQFGPEQWSVYKNKHLMVFAENHDVERIVSRLKDKDHLPLLYGLMFAMPGIPCVYYGGEWGTEGRKQKSSDREIRPYFDKPMENGLTDFISRLSRIRKNHKAFIYGGYKQLFITNLQFGFIREFEGQKYIITVNADKKPYRTTVHNVYFQAENLFTGEKMQFDGNIHMHPHSVNYYKIK